MYELRLPRARSLSLNKPQVMGILNATPDSFSDGGKFIHLDSAVEQVNMMLADRATIIDIGGESTRPGAPDVELKEELERVIPIIKAVRAQSDCVISVDTSKAEVMKQAIEAGADIINDVRALQEPGALEIAAQYAEVPICLMHMQGEPRSMQNNPKYNDLFSDINQFFEARIRACKQAGIDTSRLILDPGFGFGKSLEHNFQILGGLKQFNSFNLPILTGLSRKSMFGQLLTRETHERVAASLAGALICAQQGAHIIRVHDVKETSDVLNVWLASVNGVTQ
ncbi:dihydropteroate synthase [Pseudoalteromonas peptidolytica]|uniref:Dihydropteroate synthase n=1 Tax=Pseudoalteromonas peptidolytica F12-50-A1 TaxID=1315280 RepID=A0A8I0MV98_9GAMM|nr:dihydropteroate synthase [Pseudoalteromonas peptidolytica]MBE0346002.1 dihydropteroate synthase [Pseudoalteromonas peptidolytica F12-50-A1]NLR14751.1 dihydropteroate synthase [Pseudoalteromonas peptidolytica]GEK10927.1 dihydropteroate synthase [Pseudoalteromonas peptidolytica]